EPDGLSPPRGGLQSNGHATVVLHPRAPRVARDVRGPEWRNRVKMRDVGAGEREERVPVRWWRAPGIGQRELSIESREFQEISLGAERDVGFTVPGRSGIVSRRQGGEPVGGEDCSGTLAVVEAEGGWACGS